jgi:hypothetical protein
MESATAKSPGFFDAELFGKLCSESLPSKVVSVKVRTLQLDAAWQGGRNSEAA